MPSHQGPRRRCSPLTCACRAGNRMRAPYLPRHRQQSARPALSTAPGEELAGADAVVASEQRHAFMPASTSRRRSVPSLPEVDASDAKFRRGPRPRCITCRMLVMCLTHLQERDCQIDWEPSQSQTGPSAGEKLYQEANLTRCKKHLG